MDETGMGGVYFENWGKSRHFDWPDAHRYISQISPSLQNLFMFTPGIGRYRRGYKVYEFLRDMRRTKQRLARKRRKSPFTRREKKARALAQSKAISVPVSSVWKFHKHYGR